jgi:L-alanine-DL-glutamate epimerase-like enolase superfamily enzyme
MKLESIKTFVVGNPPPGFGGRYFVFVKIRTACGIEGVGEAYAATFSPHIIAAMAEDLFARVFAGEDPMQTETLWRQNKQQAWWYGYHGGIASYATSAIDIALWDLKGKALGKSVLDLLGGPAHERLPAIASCHGHYESIEEMAEETAEWVSTGLQGLKTGFGKRGNANLGYNHDRDVAYVKAMREVLGTKMLMIDNGINIRWDVTDAVRRAVAMEEFNLAWIEEPLGAWDPEGYANLRAKTTTRIAYGEREWTLEQFERVLATGTVDVIGVDPGRAEGITGFKKITERCEFYRRQANAHAWSSAIVTAASLAISFNSPACKLFELKPLRNPMQHDLVTKPFDHVDGWMYPPTGPGLGIEVIEEVVEGYRSEKVLARL